MVFSRAHHALCWPRPIHTRSYLAPIPHNLGSNTLSSLSSFAIPPVAVNWRIHAAIALTLSISPCSLPSWFLRPLQTQELGQVQAEQNREQLRATLLTHLSRVRQHLCNHELSVSSGTFTPIVTLSPPQDPFVPGKHASDRLDSGYQPACSRPKPASPVQSQSQPGEACSTKALRTLTVSRGIQKHHRVLLFCVFLGCHQTRVLLNIY